MPDHDVLVLHHLTPSLLPSAVTDAIQEGRAIWVMGGASTTWNDWDLNVVGFQHAPEPLVTEAQGQTTATFESFPLPSELDRMLAMWPPLACPTGEYSTTPALVSALTQQVGPVSTDWPLWAVREGDARRVAVTLGEGLWRWRMQDLVRHDGESVAFDDLVNRTLQYLSSRDDVKRLRVRVPERLDEDLRCEWVAEVYDASLSPTVDVEVTLELTKQNGQPTVHRFVENPRAQTSTWTLACSCRGSTTGWPRVSKMERRSPKRAASSSTRFKPRQASRLRTTACSRGLPFAPKGNTWGRWTNPKIWNAFGKRGPLSQIARQARTSSTRPRNACPCMPSYGCW